jgi:hypothetical protein
VIMTRRHIVLIVAFLCMGLYCLVHYRQISDIKAYDRSWVSLEPLTSLSSNRPFTARVDRVSVVPPLRKGTGLQSGFMVIMLTRDDGTKQGFVEQAPSTSTIQWGETLLTQRSYVFPGNRPENK